MSENKASDGPIFPIETFREILSYADEASLWRLRRCCKALSELAEPELVPFLAEKTLEVEPSLIADDIYAPGRDMTAETDNARHDALIRASDRLAAHFVAYPPSASHLRSLTIEVRDDNTSAGWSHIRRCAASLDHLAVRIIDRSANPVLGDTSLDLDKLWGKDIEGYGVAHVRFPKLLSLHVHTTARLLNHARSFIINSPNLLELKLSSGSDCEAVEGLSPLGVANGGLVRLSFSGTGPALLSLLDSLGPLDPPAVLTVNLTTGSYGIGTLDHILRGLAGWHLRHLCLYGLCSGDLVTAALYSYDLHCLADVQDLVLEHLQTRDDDGRRKYSLLEPASFRPDLPSLKRLIFVDRSETPEKHKDTTLRGLLTRYPTLEQILLIAGSPLYPADPFADGPPSTWAERNVVCCAERLPDDGSVRITRPPCGT